MKIPITKRRPAVNLRMLALALAILANTVTMTLLMMIEGVQTRYVIGFALSFIGVFVYGFQFLWHGSRVFYYKKVREDIDLTDVSDKNLSSDRQETSHIYVTEEGKLLY